MHLGVQAECVQFHPPNAPWPKTDIMKRMPFDYIIHDAKYDDISSIYCPGFKPVGESEYFVVFITLKGLIFSCIDVN